MNNRRHGYSSNCSRPALRILVASVPPTAPGPLPKITPLLVDGLRSLGCHVVTTNWGSGIGRASVCRRAAGRAKDLFEIWHKAKRSLTDVVVIQTAHDRASLVRDIPLMLGLRGLARTRVVQFHGSRPEKLLEGGHPLFRAASWLLVASASAVLVLSTEERDKWTYFRPKSRIYVVKNPHEGPPPDLNPVDQIGERVLENHLAASSIIRLVDANRVPTILFVGRLIPEKGILDLVEAAGLLASTAPESPFQIVIAGDGPEASQILTRAQALSITHMVLLVGHVGPDELASLYHRATLLVLPSYSEGFPTVIAEAMAAGLPIVTTAIRGAADHLEDGVNALLIPPGNPTELAHALRRLLDDPGLCRLMGEQNLRKVTSFAPEKVAAEYLDILLQIVSGSVS